MFASLSVGYNHPHILENRDRLTEAALNKPTNSVFRRQDAPEVFDITTVVYVANVEFIMNNASLFDGTVTSVEVPRHRAVDIDDIDDFNLAESILNNTFNEGDQC